ncbi:hypothetical protein D3C78_1881620 [compost metagenome]
MGQGINLLGDQLLMFVRGAEQFVERGVFRHRGGHRVNARQAAGIGKIIKETLHVGHLFLRVTA